MKLKKWRNHKEVFAIYANYDFVWLQYKIAAQTSLFMCKWHKILLPKYD